MAPQSTTSLRRCRRTAEGILDSISRRALPAAMAVQERPSPSPDVLRAREAFLAGTLREIQAVAAIGSVELSPVPRPSPGKP